MARRRYIISAQYRSTNSMIVALPGGSVRSIRHGYREVRARGQMCGNFGRMRWVGRK
jgi:hypothetical protein